MTAPDRARLRELLDSKCVCTDEAELEICPRCLGLMSWIEVQLPGLLDALDEAEKALRKIGDRPEGKAGSVQDTLVRIAREALARIGAGE